MNTRIGSWFWGCVSVPREVGQECGLHLGNWRGSDGEEGRSLSTRVLLSLGTTLALLSEVRCPCLQPPAVASLMVQSQCLEAANGSWAQPTLLGKGQGSTQLGQGCIYKRTALSPWWGPAVMLGGLTSWHTLSWESLCGCISVHHPAP